LERRPRRRQKARRCTGVKDGEVAVPAAPRIAVVGDYVAAKETHRAIDAELAAAGVDFVWVATATVSDAAEALAGCAGVVMAPGEYGDVDGALRAIEHARSRGVPLVAMCSGFQHVVLEFARNVLGLTQAAHAETDPEAALLAVTPLACSLVGQSQRVQLEPHSRVGGIYGIDAVTEPFYCSYGVNPALEPDLEAAGLHVSGRDAEGSARVLEFADHPFFVATLYVFPAREEHTPSHPLTISFLAASERAAPALRA
jgi:CTP synthase (UTP-ammonia lyase)